jgi:hypothetical protein
MYSLIQSGTVVAPASNRFTVTIAIPDTYATELLVFVNSTMWLTFYATLYQSYNPTTAPIVTGGQAGFFSPAIYMFQSNRLRTDMPIKGIELLMSGTKADFSYKIFAKQDPTNLSGVGMNIYNTIGQPVFSTNQNLLVKVAGAAYYNTYTVGTTSSTTTPIDIPTALATPYVNLNTLTQSYARINPANSFNIQIGSYIKYTVLVSSPAVTLTTTTNTGGRTLRVYGGNRVRPLPVTVGNTVDIPISQQQDMKVIYIA